MGELNKGNYIIGNIVYINGKRLPPLPNQSKKYTINNTTIINNRVFINGYEYKDGQWKKTLRALWHTIF